MNTQFRWFYSKDKVGEPKPSMCVCLVEESGHSGIGLALCSRKDNPRYSTGREIALARAKYALTCDEPKLLINREEALNVLEDVKVSMFDFKAMPSGVDRFQAIIDNVWPPKPEKETAKPN